MADDTLAQKRNTGAAPVEAEANHVREKTFDAPSTPAPVAKEKEELPEATTRDKVREEMPGAADEVKKRV